MMASEVTVLDDKGILRMAIRERGTNQINVSEKLGIKQCTLSSNMNRERMGLDNFKKILDVLDYDVMVVDRKTGEAVWCLDVED